MVRSPHWNDRSKGDNEKMLGCHAVFGTSTTTSKQITGSDTFAPVCPMSSQSTWKQHELKYDIRPDCRRSFRGIRMKFISPV